MALRKIGAGESISDEEFDRVYPEWAQEKSRIHWTPIHVAKISAQMLVQDRETRVLDLGSGVGKFCLVAATSGVGHYTGVEQRARLVKVAQAVASKFKLARVNFINKNIVDVSLQQFDAFYFYNSFAENLFDDVLIDEALPRSIELFRKYSKYLKEQFSLLPVGTRVVTYHHGLDLPDNYKCQSFHCGNRLELWIKRRTPIKTRLSSES